MFRLREVLCIGTLLLALLSRGQQQRDSVLDRVISVHVDRQSVAAVLEQITHDYGIFFSYDASLVASLAPVSVHMQNSRVAGVLDEIFGPGRFHFLGKNNHVIISAVPREELPPQHTDTLLLPPVITLTGKIVDYITKMPLRDVTVSLKGRTVGTITNKDGEFILKLPPENITDTLSISTLGYAHREKQVNDFEKEEMVYLQPISFRIREIKVRAVSVDEILSGIRDNIDVNYPTGYQLLDGFYRETIRQDDKYISVSEAVVEMLKAPYQESVREDKIRLVKARRSPDVQPFHWVDFKLQGEPDTMTMLDVVKKMETFLDPEFQLFYRYTIHEVIWYKSHPAFVIRFRPVKEYDFPCYAGEMFVDRRSYAVLYARFSLDNHGLNIAEKSLIRKKPAGFKVKPQFVDYEVDYSEHEGKWHLHTAQASVAFRVKSPKEKVNSIFHSVLDLLVTHAGETELKRFPGKDLFTVNDIFTEMSVDYDENFWGNYNIIKPDEDLQNAVRKIMTSGSL